MIHQSSVGSVDDCDYPDIDPSIMASISNSLTIVEEAVYYFPVVIRVMQHEHPKVIQLEETHEALSSDLDVTSNPTVWV
jgi:hypothetical protein